MARHHVDFDSACFVIRLFDLVLWLLKLVYEVIRTQLTNDIQLFLETLWNHCGVKLLVALYLLSCCVEVLVAQCMHAVLQWAKVPNWTDLEHWLLERKLLGDAAFQRVFWLEHGSLGFLIRLDIGDVLWR